VSAKLLRVLPATVVAVSLLSPACSLLRRHDASEVVAPIDLNTASRRQVEKLPGVTPSMAGRIVEGRPYRDPYELVERGILTEREFKRVADRVTVKAQGE
jgi:DNA uptake protein ComE-like DNA-binding protein